LGDFGDPRREQRVIRICERATQIDPEYPQAWALMALAQANLCHGFTGNDGLDDGSAAADRALTLDPTIAEAHLPKAWNLAARGLDAEANAEAATALHLGPNSWEVNKESARLYYRQGRLQDAALHLEKATELMETDFHGLGMLFACYHAQGDVLSAERIAEKIIEQVENVVVKDPDNGAALAFGALSFAMIGEIQRAEQWMERGMLVDPDNWMMRYNFAWGLNKVFKNEEAAIEMLRPVLEHAGQNIIRLAAKDPNLDSLREDHRMQQMMDVATKRVAELSRQLLE
jgi:adenylate cyclase